MIATMPMSEAQDRATIKELWPKLEAVARDIDVSTL
jgi:hypothetical protein